VNKDGETMFFDSVSGKPLFIAPRGRTFEQFRRESDSHGWPSFRDQEVVWDNVRAIRGDNEAVSVDGTHLGHNIPDSKGNRYCINLVSIAGSGDPSSVDMSSLTMAGGEAGFTEESCGAAGKSSPTKCTLS
jgi:peptide methionine sulfoxide reductase MsrB